MILVLIYWCYLLIISSAIGIGLSKLLKLNLDKSALLIPFLGGFGVTVIASIVAIWGNLGSYFEIALATVSLFLTVIYRGTISNYLFLLKAKILELQTFLKFIFIVVFLLALAQSSTAPYMIDNETYYIQTIKWLDAYGFVPGLANLHFFLSQMSGFHILQSATNLDGLYSHFNDLSGFYLILGNLYALSHLQTYFKTKGILYLIIGLFPIFNVFLFQFIGAPSPDILIYVLALIIFSEYLKHYKTPNKDIILLLFIVSVFAIYIKLTALLFILLPLHLAIKEKVFKRVWLPAGIVGISMLALFLIKNSIITGHPVYPVVSEYLTITAWALPNNLQEFFSEQTKLHGFFMQASDYKQAGLKQLIIRWLTLPKLHGLFNSGILVLLVIAPFFIRNMQYRKPLSVIYGLGLAQMIMLWISSPQYRYFFMYFMILCCVCLAGLKLKKTLLIVGLAIVTALIAIPLFVPLNLNNLTANEFHMNLSTFSLDYVVTPHRKSKYSQAQFKSFVIGKDTLNTPANIDFFWATGDGPLPCVQENQVLYFAQEYRIIPQCRGATLKDGFYSKILTDE